MNDTPKTFSFNGQDLRVAFIEGEAWFAVKDVCAALGILGYADFLKLLRDDEKIVVQFHDTDNERYSLLSFINKNALFRLIEAEKSRSMLNEITQRQILVFAAGLLLSLPEHTTFNKAKKLLDMSGLSGKLGIFSE